MRIIWLHHIRLNFVRFVTAAAVIFSEHDMSKRKQVRQIEERRYRLAVEWRKPSTFVYFHWDKSCFVELWLSHLIFLTVEYHLREVKSKKSNTLAVAELKVERIAFWDISISVFLISNIFIWTGLNDHNGITLRIKQVRNLLLSHCRFFFLQVRFQLLIESLQLSILQNEEGCNSVNGKEKGQYQYVFPDWAIDISVNDSWCINANHRYHDVNESEYNGWRKQKRGGNAHAIHF